jgi:hypothetical protein
VQEVRHLVASPLADVGTERDRLRHLVAHRLADTRARVVELQLASLRRRTRSGHSWSLAGTGA